MNDNTTVTNIFADAPDLAAWMEQTYPESYEIYNYNYAFPLNTAMPQGHPFLGLNTTLGEMNGLSLLLRKLTKLGVALPSQCREAYKQYDKELLAMKAYMLAGARAELGLAAPEISPDTPKDEVQAAQCRRSIADELYTLKAYFSENVSGMTPEAAQICNKATARLCDLSEQLKGDLAAIALQQEGDSWVRTYAATPRPSRTETRKERPAEGIVKAIIADPKSNVFSLSGGKGRAGQ